MTIDIARLKKMESFAELASLLAVQRATEERIKEKRIVIEERIAELIPCGETSSKTVSISGDTGDVKITVKRGLSYKADLGAIEEALAGVTEFVPIKSTTKKELDVKGYEWFRDNDKGVFNEIAKHVTVTPRKTSVTLKYPK